MVTQSKVNSKNVIKITPPKYFHCFKLSDSSYALFDIKMDMPIIIGSLAIIKSTQLPTNSIVFYYEIKSKGFFEKRPEKTIDVKGDGKHQKAPLRYHNLKREPGVYHHFKLTPILFSFWDNEFDMPIVYGSNQKVQATINNIADGSIVYYYKEDANVKNSFKQYMTFESKNNASHG
jgi:hypothetical protein